MNDKLISIVVPTLNEEKNIVRFLNSIAKQDYPHSLIELIVVDARSRDATRDLIEEWRSSHDIKVHIVDNDRTIAEYGKSVGLKLAKGDYVCTVDCDEEFVQSDLFSRYCNVLEVMPDVIGMEHHFVKTRQGSSFNDFLALIHINDPLARQIADKPVELRCVEIKGACVRVLRISPAYPSMLFLRRRYIAPYIDLDTYEEGQVVMDLALSGHDIIARIDGYGVHHYHVQSFRGYIKKRSKIALKHMTRITERKTWVSYTGKKIHLYALLNLTLIHPMVYAMAKAVRERDVLWLYWFPAATGTTFVYVINWVFIKITGKRAW